MQIQKKAQESGKIFPVSRALTYAPDQKLQPVPTEEKPTQERTMMLNMGPQHPSTHGVLRLVLEIDGEDIVKAYPHVGYLHRGFEKLGEYRTYHQYITYTDRLDYLAPLSNNVAYAQAVEKLMGIEITERAKYIRVMCCELSRISGHLLSLGTFAMDLGAMTIFFHTFQQREMIYNLHEALTGTRMTTSYTRIGGLARDLPEMWNESVEKVLRDLEPVIDDVERLLNKNPIWVDRTKDILVIDKHLCQQYGLTGPILRATGDSYDIRKEHPYLVYDRFDFDIPVGTCGDAYDRYMIRVMEIRESIKILRQALAQVPQGPIQAEVPGVVLPSQQKVYENMEELINHFKIISEGFHPPVGDSYSSIESPKGELGFYIVSDGGPNAYRMRIKSPSFTNIQVLPEILPGYKIADVVTAISSIDPVMGECDR
ncbi:MAG: NADH dehydrogenase (quinone) subunit D [Bdellovibrionales bacterium]|nr:NADH dehydrogenase (quinone) subunit D [Bdellovibrionales bacterium]